MSRGAKQTSRTAARALVITRNLPPIQGGIERLMARAIEALAADFACDVIGPRGCRRFLPPGTRVLELPSIAPAFLLLAPWAVLGLRLRYRYALCVAGSGLAGPVAALAAWLSRCPWLVFVHGLDLVAPHRLYQALFLPVLRRADGVIANSRHTAGLAERSGIRPARLRIVNPGVAPPAPVSADFRHGRGLGPGPLLLSVGRLVARKGLAEFIEHALPRVVAAHPDARYVVVGAEPQHAGPGRGARERIVAAARRAGVHQRVLLTGALSDAELAAAYATADVLIFPSLGGAGDVEGFGMVILEAAAHGVPAVAFDTGGVADAMSADNGALVPAGDYSGYAGAVLHVLAERRAPLTRARCRDHAVRHGWERFADAVRAAAGNVLRPA